MNIIKCAGFTIKLNICYIGHPDISLYINRFSYKTKSEDDIDYILDDRKESYVSNDEYINLNSKDYLFKIYRTKESDYLWVKYNCDNDIACAYYVSKNFKIWTLVKYGSESFYEAFLLLANIFSYAVLPYGGIVFHGVIMEWNGMGVIISAVSGGGKTTHARLWRDHENALIINGDRSLCRKVDEQWYAFGQPWCGTSGECVNRRVPIKAFVMIKKNSENSIKQIEPYNAALCLAQRVFAPRGNKELMNYTFDYIDDIVENIPVYELQCTPDVNAVETLKKVLITL